jgi:hypothetical protein
MHIVARMKDRGAHSAIDTRGVVVRRNRRTDLGNAAMKSRSLLRIVLLIAALVLLASCGVVSGHGATPTGTPGAPLITADELKAQLDAGSNIAIVDSRSPSYYEESHIPGAISLPLIDMLDEDHNALPPEEIDRLFGCLKSYDEIVTYCT